MSQFLYELDLSDNNSDVVQLEDGRFYEVPRSFNSTNEVAGVKNGQEMLAHLKALAEEAAQLVGIPIDHFDQEWLGRLLAQFIHRDAFFDIPSDDKINPEKDEIHRRYLVEMFCKVRQARAQAQKVAGYIQLGDQALFMAGVFPERIKKELGNTGIDYYIDMSHTGYRLAADLMRNGADFILQAAYRVKDYRKVIRCISLAGKTDRVPFAQLLKSRGMLREVFVA